jgi:magnesium-transporting ATPase (P-type)
VVLLVRGGVWMIFLIGSSFPPPTHIHPPPPLPSTLNPQLLRCSIIRSIKTIQVIHTRPLASSTVHLDSNPISSSIPPSYPLMSKSSLEPLKKVPSVPPNWPNPSEDDLKERPNRLINIGRAQDYLFPTNFVKTSKYEWYNFLPKFFLEEFNPKYKIANCYFLLIAILQCIPAISNTQGYPTVLIPLTFVVTVDGIFAALEDMSRHRADTEANSAYTKRYEIHSQATEEILWSNIHVGDFIKIHSREKIPADIVVISCAEKTSPPQGLCYVETKSLDGETNLKTRQALKGTLAKVSFLTFPLPFFSFLSSYS